MTTTYIALIGALALAAALACGLGGRDAAAQLVNSGYSRAQEQSEQVGRDMATGKERAQRDAEHAHQAVTGNGRPATVGEYAAERGSDASGSYRRP